MEAGAFAAVEEAFNKLLTYSTPFGHFWTFVVVIFRLLPAIFLGEGIYADEQDDFECITTLPGCSQMCFTLFSPVQPTRMWCLQILLSCLPPVIFNFYASNQTARYERIEEELKEYKTELGESFSNYGTDIGTDNLTGIESTKYMKYNKLIKRQKRYKQKHLTAYDVSKPKQRQAVLWSPEIRFGYFLHLFFKLIMELLFFYTVYWYQKQQTNKSGITEVWYSPVYYICNVAERMPGKEIDEPNACQQAKDVVCWISRPKEKEWYLFYNIVMQLLSILIIFGDIIFVIGKNTIKYRANKKKRRNLYLQPPRLTPQTPSGRNTPVKV